MYLLRCLVHICKPTEYVRSTIPVSLVRYSFQKKKTLDLFPLREANAPNLLNKFRDIRVWPHYLSLRRIRTKHRHMYVSV